jgi:proteasome lid subunit RPN8/RPN11
VTPYKPIDVVITNPDALTAFKRRALKSPKFEILGVLVGRVKGKIYIDNVVYPQQEAVTGPGDLCKVHYWPDEFRSIKGAIGTIHSHPSVEPGLSKEDMISQATDGDVVFAVYSFWKKKNSERRSTSLDFYCGSPEIIVSTGSDLR